MFSPVIAGHHAFMGREQWKLYTEATMMFVYSWKLKKKYQKDIQLQMS